MRAPLAGMRVIEIDAIGAVPFAAMLLADLGCEVVRIVQPGSGTHAIVPAMYRGRQDATLDFREPAAIADEL